MLRFVEISMGVPSEYSFCASGVARNARNAIAQDGLSVSRERAR